MTKEKTLFITMILLVILNFVSLMRVASLEDRIEIMEGVGNKKDIQVTDTDIEEVYYNLDALNERINDVIVTNNLVNPQELD